MSGLFHLQPVLDLSFPEAEAFCESQGFTAFKMFVDSLPVAIPDIIKTIPNRVEFELYCDACVIQRVCKATFYRNGERLTTIEPDECDECGGPCDGVHGSITSSNETQIQILVESLLSQPAAILDEVLRRVSSKRINSS